MDTKRYFKNCVETSEGKTVILQAEFDDFGGSDVTFSVDIRRYKFFLIRSPYAKVMAVNRRSSGKVELKCKFHLSFL